MWLLGNRPIAAQHTHRRRYYPPVESRKSHESKPVWKCSRILYSLEHLIVIRCIQLFKPDKSHCRRGKLRKLCGLKIDFGDYYLINMFFASKVVPDLNKLSKLIAFQNENLAHFLQEAITERVKELNSLKAEYKQLSGQDWNPQLVDQIEQKKSTAAEPKSKQTASGLDKTTQLLFDIKEVGDQIRQLKEQKASKVQ